jgi:tetratricopeptide (TPR) repeat protein
VSESSSRRLFGALQLAYLELRYRERPAHSLAIVDSVLALQPLDDMLPADRPYDQLARFYAEAGELERARTLLAAADSNNRALDRLWPADRAWVRAVILLAEGDVRGAETPLREAADTNWCHICPLPDLARAYHAAGRPDAALATYEAYLSTPWLWRYENDAIELGHVCAAWVSSTRQKVKRRKQLAPMETW